MAKLLRVISFWAKTFLVAAATFWVVDWTMYQLLLTARDPLERLLWDAYFVACGASMGRFTARALTPPASLGPVAPLDDTMFAQPSLNATDVADGER